MCSFEEDPAKPCPGSSLWDCIWLLSEATKCVVLCYLVMENIQPGKGAGSVEVYQKGISFEENLGQCVLSILANIQTVLQLVMHKALVQISLTALVLVLCSRNNLLVIICHLYKFTSGSGSSGPSDFWRWALMVCGICLASRVQAPGTWLKLASSFYLGSCWLWF